MATEPHYSVISEASTIVSGLCEKYPDVFWAVNPDMVIVMGIDNKVRSDSQKKKIPYFMKMKAIKGSEKALLMENNISSRYIFEAYWDEWNDWPDHRRQVMLFNELLKITADVGKVNSYDCSGFKILMKEFGVNWNVSDKELKDMIINDIDFDLDLRPGLNGDNPEEVDDDDEDVVRSPVKKDEEVVRVTGEDESDESANEGWKTMDAKLDPEATVDENLFE